MERLHRPVGAELRRRSPVLSGTQGPRSAHQIRHAGRFRAGRLAQQPAQRLQERGSDGRTDRAAGGHREYQYATGFSAAIAISTKILAKEEGIVEKYKAFLSGGCSMDPIDLLKLCGVDMEKKEPVEEALKVFEQYLTELEKLV